MKREDLRKILRGKCISDESCEAAIDELLNLHIGSKCYTEKDMDNAYDKGFKYGNQGDLTGSLIEANGLPAFGTKEFNDMCSNFFGGKPKSN